MASSNSSSGSSRADVAAAMAYAQADEPTWPRKAQKRPADDAAFLRFRPAGFISDSGSLQNIGAGLQQPVAFDYNQGQPVGTPAGIYQYTPSTQPVSGEGFTGQGHGHGFGLYSLRWDRELK